MPKIRCICDTVINLSVIPCPHKLMIISEKSYFNYPENIEWDSLYSEMNIVVKCPECGRLHIFGDGFENPQVIYKIEE